MKNCRFCWPLDQKNKSLLLKQSKNFYIMASIGSMVEGFLLLCSKKHYSSCGNLPSGLYSEFNSLKKEIKDIFTKVYDGYTFFEHGKIKGCCSQNGDSAHCFHAHLQALSIGMNILPQLITRLGNPIEISSHQEIIKVIKETPYLYYETSKGAYVWPAPLNLEQQFFRMVLARQLRIPQKVANWKVTPDWEKAKAIQKKLNLYFNS